MGIQDKRLLYVTMPDESVWSVPVEVVIRHRYNYYLDMGKAEPDDERPGDYEIHDWAIGNMNWDDVVTVARKVKDQPALTPSDFQEGWVNGEKKIRPGPGEATEG